MAATQIFMFNLLMPETKETTVLLIFLGKRAIWIQTNTKSQNHVLSQKERYDFCTLKCIWGIKETKKGKKNFFKSQIYCFLFTKIQYVIMSQFHESPENMFHHLLPHTDTLGT